MAWTSWQNVGSAGSNTGATTIDFTGATAPGANKRLKITGFQIDWNNNGSYLYGYNTNTTNSITIKLVSGSTSVTIGTYSNKTNGARPTISWDGTMICPVNTKLQYVQTATGDGCIKNLFKIRVNVTTLTRPTVAAGDPITKAQMDSLRTWKGSGTEVTQGALATAAHGNTYKSGLTAGTTAMDDAWYNSVT